MFAICTNDWTLNQSIISQFNWSLSSVRLLKAELLQNNDATDYNFQPEEVSEQLDVQFLFHSYTKCFVTMDNQQGKKVM